LPEPLLHFALPFSLSVLKLGFKKAILLGLIALLPDIDVLLRVHRSWTHSLVVLSVLSGAVLLMVAMFKPGDLKFSYLSTLSLLSHPIIDLFQTNTPILWPILNRSVWLKIEAWVTIPQNLIPNIYISVESILIEFTTFTQMDAPITTSLGFVISLILVSVSALTRMWVVRLDIKVPGKRSG